MSDDTMTATIPDVKFVTARTAVPRDLHVLRPWFNIIRRLRSVVPVGGTYSIAKITVLMCDGEPIKWTAPQVTALEPRVERGDFEQLLGVLAD